MHAATRTRARLLGLLAGAGLALMFLAAGRIAPSRAPLGASLELATGSTAELLPAPAGVLLHARDLRPGASVAHDASFTLRNPTDVMLAVRVALRGGRGELDELLSVRLLKGRRVLFEGTLGGLRRAGSRAFAIPAGSRRRITLTVRPAAGARGFEGRGERAALHFTTRVGGR